MKGIEDFSASKVISQNRKRVSTSQTRLIPFIHFTALQVRLPQLPLEEWGPFVFAMSDPAAAAQTEPVSVQLQAIQVLYHAAQSSP
jgi:hypothetical protein